MIRLVQSAEVIREFCRDRNVLHLGCTNYPYTEDAIKNKMLVHFDLEKVAGRLTGFDFDQAGLDILASHGSTNLYQADLEKLEEVDCSEKFDVIVAGEMIEHLNNPGLFLNGIKRFMSSETRLMITTINAYCAMRFAIYGLRGKGGLNEPVHPDHVAYYSYKTLKLLIERHDFEIDDFMFYDVGTEHRPYLRKIHNIINDVAVRISPQLADGVIAVCRLGG
jgi:ubiquinone/menaquinone biosynthesis C-methylase UbiE